jgi:hypothetical protein
MRSRGYPVRDAQGKIVRWHGILEDIEDQHDALVERRDAEEKMRNQPLIPWISEH